MTQPMTSIRLPRALEVLLGPNFQEAAHYDVRIEGVGEDSYIRVYKRLDGGHVAMAAGDEVVGLKAQLAASLAPAPADEDQIAFRDSSAPVVKSLKGGPLAQRAGILCNEGGFRVFIGAADKDHAATIIREKCGITSRAELDHNNDAARKFTSLSRDYEAWLRDE